jgi:hypothetical protein
MAALVVAARAFYCWGWAQHAFEDAYINFRIAAHWLATGSPHYNVGENVMAGTSALWLMVTTAAQWFSGPTDPSSFMFILAIAADLGTHRLGLRVLPSMFGQWLWTVGFALMPVFLMAAGYGLETNLVMLCIVAAAVLEGRGRWVALGLLAAVRPDTPVYAVALAAVLPGWRRNLLAVAAGVALQAGLNLALWGVVVPQSVTAKRLVYGVHLFKGHAFVDWIAPWGNNYFAEARGLTMLAAAWIPALAVVRDRRVWALLAAALAMVAVQLTIAPFAFRWYLTASVLAVLLVACHALSRQYVGRWARVLVAGCFAVALVGHVWRVMQEDARRLAMEQVYFTAGQWVSQNVPPHISVWLEPAGIAPYLFKQNRVIDEVGIITPAIAVDRHERGDGWLYRGMVNEKPGLLLMRYGNFAMNVPLGGAGTPFENREQRKWMAQHYQAVSYFRAEPQARVSDERGLIVALVRLDVPRADTVFTELGER